MPKKPNKAKNACYTEQPNQEGKKRPYILVSPQMNTLRRIPTDFLFSKPSLASGAARLVDFGCSFDSYNKSATPAEADFRAMLADWLAVGFDILDATDLIEQEKKTA